MKRRRQNDVVVLGRDPKRVVKNLSGELQSRYYFRLYIAGSNLNSNRAIKSIRELCRSLYPAQCELEIIDLYQQPSLAKRDDIVAAPALIKRYPPPIRTFVGDLSDRGKVLSGLGITGSKDVGI
jgi:circadian clock protein KaiB